MNLLESLVRRPQLATPARHTEWKTSGDVRFPLLGFSTNVTPGRESIDPDFISYAQYAYKGNGAVFAAQLARMSLFCQARPIFQRLREGKPAGTFWDPDLKVFEEPWTGADSTDFMSRALLYADVAGNAFAIRRPGGLRFMRPDWVDIVLAAPVGMPPEAVAAGIDVDVAGYLYHEGGKYVGSEPQQFSADEVMHFAPHPDPEAMFRGMSWMTPVIREIQADTQATIHKQRYFENGAAINLVVQLGTDDEEQFGDWVQAINRNHSGPDNANRTLFLAAGSDAKTLGANMSEADFGKVQAVGEDRIAAAAGLHVALLGLQDGNQGSALNAGNFSAIRRSVGDKTMRHLWANFFGSAKYLTKRFSDARLWYDDDIPFMRDDATDVAEIQQKNATTIRQLVDAGFEPVSVVEAVTKGDMNLLSHTNLYSVQLQAPGAGQPAPVA